jgi:hypothetical protein
MKWYKEIYLGNVPKKKIKKIKFRLKHNVLLPSIYIITLSLSETEQLDIIPAKELLQKAYPKKELCIVGIAKNQEDSFCLIQRIVEDVFQKDKTVNIRKFFRANEDKLWFSL